MRIRIGDQRFVLSFGAPVERHDHEQRKRFGDRNADQKPRRAGRVAPRSSPILFEQQIGKQQSGNEFDNLFRQLGNAGARHALQALQIPAVRAHERDEQQCGSKRHHRILRADVAAEHDRTDPFRAEEHQRGGHDADQQKQQKRTAKHAPRAVVVADRRALGDHA